MPKPYPRKFREDVVGVARSRESGLRIKDIADDFAISESCLNGWLKRVDIEDDVKLGVTDAEQRETRELRKHLRLLKQENEVLRRVSAYLSRANLAGK